MLILNEILEPISSEQFLDKYWLKTALYIPSMGLRKFEKIFSWKQFNYLLNFSSLDKSAIELIVEGKSLSMHGINTGDLLDGGNLTSFFQKGATLKINQIHKRIVELSEFTTLLRHDIGYDVNVNTYCSFPGTQAYDCHYDTHEIIVLQIEGTKKWKVFNDTLKHPSRKQRSVFLEPPDDEAYLECILHPGDVLYIPRGHWHYALAFDQPSLHLTLGINCPIGIDFIQWMIDDLHKKEDWRISLPLYTLEDNAEALREKLNVLVHKLTEYVNDEDLSLRYISYLKALEKPSQAYSLPFQAGYNIFSRESDTKFSRPISQKTEILEIGENEYKISVWNKEIILRQVPKRFVETLFTKYTFTVQDITNWFPNLEWEAEIAPILSTLVMEGVITVDGT